MALIAALVLPASSRADAIRHEGAGSHNRSGVRTPVKRHAARKAARRLGTPASLSPGAVARRPDVSRPGRSKPRRRSSPRRVERIAVEWVDESTEAEVYGPSLPPSEAYDFPPSPLAICDGVDVVREARVHDQSPEADEARAVQQESEDGTARGLTALARQIRSLFRPKSASARVTPEDVDLTNLLSARLRIPVEGADVQRLRDSFLDRRGRYREHLAIDIGAPRGTPVLATTDGEISRLRRERQGGISIYQKDATGKYLFFYCHLSRYAAGLSPGQSVRAGEVIGYVGATGHVIGGAHLHFSITRLPESDDFRDGLAINPYLLFLAGVP